MEGYKKATALESHAGHHDGDRAADCGNQGCAMRILIACEFSGRVRDAFARRGHDAWSCDLLPSETAGQHIQGDVRERFTWTHWDLIIAFPPCTHLAVSGARWFKDKGDLQPQAIQFFLDCANAPAARVAVENPVSIMSRLYRKPDQIIQPWQFGHGETKATCLWLKGLPLLQPTHCERPDLFAKPAPNERIARVWREPPSADRQKNRSRTYEGIAEAMAEQWGAILTSEAA